MNHQKPHRVIVSVTNDLVTDNRVHKVCTTLTNAGCEVLLLGRELPQSPALEQRAYRTKRFRLLFEKGPFFYAEYNLRLFLYLLFRSFDILLSNDLDSLMANFVVSKLRRKKIIYDSHEYFTEVPELIGRPAVRKVWGLLEGVMLPRIKYAYTVCDSIARIYREKYKVDFKVVRNVPSGELMSEFPQWNTDKKVILYQGALNVGRGLEQIISAMHEVTNAELQLAGDGDIRQQLEKQVKDEGLEDRVRFLGRLSIAELGTITPKADVGLSIESDLGLNYRYALPNKLFDYIRAGVPVLVTDLPEMASLVRKFDIGMVVSDNCRENLAEAINQMLSAGNRDAWKSNLKVAAKELRWENEQEILLKLLDRVIAS